MNNDEKKQNTLPPTESQQTQPTLLSKETAVESTPDAVPTSQPTKLEPVSHLSSETNTEPTPDTPVSPENEEILVDISSIYQPVYTGAATNNADQTPAMPMPQKPIPQPLQPAPEVKPISDVVVKPKEKVVYKERGGGFIGDLFWRLFNCLGCLLFIVGLLIIGLAVWINF